MSSGLLFDALSCGYCDRMPHFMQDIASHSALLKQPIQVMLCSQSYVKVTKWGVAQNVSVKFPPTLPGPRGNEKIQ